MDAEFLDNVNGSMRGKYASYSLGLNNGGGYSGEEQNNNKIFAGRVSVGPFCHLGAV